MKKLPLLLLLLPIYSEAQKIILPLKDSDIVYEKVINLTDTSVSSDMLFTKAQSWFADVFKNSNYVLKVNDREAKQLIGKGTTFYQTSFGNNPNTYLFYSIQIDTKNGRYRYKIYNIGFENGLAEEYASKGYSHYLHDEIHRVSFESKNKAIKRYEHDFAFIDKTINNLIDNLTTYMNNRKSDDF